MIDIKATITFSRIGTNFEPSPLMEGEASTGEIQQTSELTWQWTYTPYTHPIPVRIDFWATPTEWPAEKSLTAQVDIEVAIGTGPLTAAATDLQIDAWRHTGSETRGSIFFYLELHADRPNIIQICTATEFLMFLRNSVAGWSGPRPAQFVLSAYSIQDPFAVQLGEGFMGLDSMGFSIRLTHLDILATLAGNLGFNTSSFDNWTWEPTPPSPPIEWSLEADAVSVIARNHGITGRSFHCATSFSGSPAWADWVPGPNNERFVYLGLPLLEYFAGSLAPGELAERLGSDLPIDGNSFNGYSKPLPGLRHLVLVDEFHVGDKGVLEVLRSESATGILDPGSNEAVFRSKMKEVTKAGLTTAPFRKAYQEYLETIDSDVTHWVAGAVSWEEVNPVRASEGNPWLNRGATQQQRFLHYHTIAFLRHQLVCGAIRLARTASTVIRDQPGASGDFNIVFGTNSYWGQSTRRAIDDGLGHETDICLDAFALARANSALRDGGHNSITTWMEDNSLIGYSLPRAIGHGELLRSAAMLSLPSDSWKTPARSGGPGEFGLYLRLTAGNLSQVDEILYRIFTYIGKGAKTLDYFKFAIDFKSDSWSLYPSRLKGVAKANQMIARAEPILFAGRPSRSPIAVLVTRCSEVWETDVADKLYQTERIDLATALSHAGHRVDYIDETDILGGALTTRGYRVLYLTDPNLPTTCAHVISDWVSNFGQDLNGASLAVLPGAAVEDEYGNPSSGLIDEMLGVLRRGPAIDPEIPGRGLPGKDDDPNLSEKLFLRHGAMAPLPVSQNYVTAETMPKWHFETVPNGGAALLATWVRRDGEVETVVPTPDGRTGPEAGLPALTVRSLGGKSRAYCYGVFPGSFYFQSTTDTSPDGQTSNSASPYHWQLPVRDFALVPVNDAGIVPAAKGRFKRRFGRPRPSGSRREGALSIDLLTSRVGIALVVTNWERDPRVVRTIEKSDLVEISLVLPRRELTGEPQSALGTPVQRRVSGERTILEFWLDTVDVITMRFADADTDPFQPAGPLPGYILCDIGKNIWKTVETDGAEQVIEVAGGALRRALSAHARF